MVVKGIIRCVVKSLLCLICREMRISLCLRLEMKRSAFSSMDFEVMIKKICDHRYGDRLNRTFFLLGTRCVCWDVGLNRINSKGVCISHSFFGGWLARRGLGSCSKKYWIFWNCPLEYSMIIKLKGKLEDYHIRI